MDIAFVAFNVFVALINYNVGNKTIGALCFASATFWAMQELVK